jgi:uncharacterized protein YlaI
MPEILTTILVQKVEQEQLAHGHGIAYQCHCGAKQFIQYQRLRQPKAIVTVNGNVPDSYKPQKEKSIKCDECDKYFSAKGWLRLHKLSKHKPKPISLPKPVQRMYPSRKTGHKSLKKNPDGTFTCEFCGDKLANRFVVGGHYQGHYLRGDAKKGVTT